MYELPHVVNCILKRAHDEDISVSPMKLQKLLYLLYKDFLKTTNRTLFPERFEAWKYGPALPEVHYAFESFGASPIAGYLTDSRGACRVVSLEENPDLKQSLDRVWTKYALKSGIELSMLTHDLKGPWMQAVKERRTNISDRDILREIS